MQHDDGRKLVIVPAYNEEAFIGSVLKALKPLQGRDDYEIIVVNDGSTDKTSEKAQNMGYTVITHDRNRGKTEAILTGMRHARLNGFKYLATIDADTLNLEPHMVEALFEPLMKTPPEGQTKKLMAVANFTESDNPPQLKQYALKYCGQRAFRVSAFTPYFNANPKWTTYLKVRWPEPAFNKLFNESQTCFLPDIVFRQRSTFHGGTPDLAEKYIDEQANTVGYVEGMESLRREAATKIAETRYRKDEAGKTAIREEYAETRQALEKVYLAPPSAHDAAKSSKTDKGALQKI